MTTRFDQPNDFTLAQLTAMKAQWLAEGATLFDRLATIARECGEVVESHCRVFSILTTKDVTVQLSEGSGPWNPTTGEYHFKRLIYVTVGKDARGTKKERETVVAFIDASTYRCPSIARDSLFFRPGDWVKKVLTLEPLALERQTARAIADEAKQRDQIYYQLQLDKEV